MTNTIWRGKVGTRHFGTQNVVRANDKCANNENYRIQPARVRFPLTWGGPADSIEPAPALLDFPGLGAARSHSRLSCLAAFGTHYTLVLNMLIFSQSIDRRT